MCPQGLAPCFNKDVSQRDDTELLEFLSVDSATDTN